MIFFYLLLAHLISDYLLQPDVLVNWKNHSRYGVAVHATIHFLVTTLLLFLYTHRYEVVLLSFGVASIHFVVDSIKASHDQKKGYSVAAYWTDQSVHYLTLLMFFLISRNYPEIFIAKSYSFHNYFDLFFMNSIFVTYTCLAIFITLTIEYSYYRNRRESSKTKSTVLFLDKRQMLKRLFLATLIYIGLLFALVPSVGFYFGS